jgi:hypothetical protein
LGRGRWIVSEFGGGVRGRNGTDWDLSFGAISGWVRYSVRYGIFL